MRTYLLASLGVLVGAGLVACSSTALTSDHASNAAGAGEDSLVAHGTTHDADAGDADAGDAGADADADAPPPEPPIVLVKDYGVFDLNGSAAAAPYDIDVCRELLRQAEGAVFDTDVDPFLGYDTTTKAWGGTYVVDGRNVDIAPRRVRVVEGKVKLPTGGYAKVACHVPVLWRALPLDATIVADAVHKDAAHRITLPSGPIGGFAVKGGIYRTFNDRATSDPFDMWLAWYLRDAPSTGDLGASVRAKKSIPARYDVNATDEIVEAGAMGRQPALAVSFASISTFTDATAWGLDPDSNRTTLSTWGLLPVQDPPGAATPEESLNRGQLLRLGNLVAFDPRTATKVPCSTFELTPEKRCDGILESQVGKLFDRTLAVGKPLWVRILWQGRATSEPLLTTVRVDGDGTLTTEATLPAPSALGTIGLPALGVWRTL